MEAEATQGFMGPFRPILYPFLSSLYDVPVTDGAPPHPASWVLCGSHSLCSYSSVSQAKIHSNIVFTFVSCFAVFKELLYP